MDINNQIKDNKKKIIIAIITFMYVLSPLLLINKTTFSIEDNPYENQNLSETDTLENAFVIECDKTNLSPSEPTTCSIKGKNFTKQVSSVSAKLKLGENLTLTNIIFDAIWVGDESLDGKIDIYTDINKYGDFNIGTFTIQSSNVNTGIDTNITLEDIVISDERFQEHTINNSLQDIRILSNINTLSSLTIPGYDLEFNSTTTSYNLEVPTEVSEITINATATNEYATVSGAGSKNLNYGNNTFNIIVTSENGLTKTYKITIKRIENISFKDGIKVDEENKILYFTIGKDEILTVNSILNKIETTANIVIINNKGEIISGTANTGTDSNIKIEITNNELNYKLVVLGDTTGDGKVNAIDVSKLYQQYRKTIEKEMTAIEIIAGDVMKDNIIKLNDVAKLYQYVKGSYPTLE